MSKQKSLNKKENLKAYVDFLKTSGFPYSLIVSNYTTEIVTDLAGFNIQFIQTERNNTFFAAYSKIKSDIKDKSIPVIDTRGLTYYEHDFRKDTFFPQVINIDLKSAYATALYKKDFIRDITFQYLSKISKLDRLASVGMLASKKHIFKYDGNNKLLGYKKIVNKYENFFFFCVQEVQNIMQDLRILSGANYLFTWVDGIYLQPEPGAIIDLCNYLEDRGYPFKIETLQNFTVTVKAAKIEITFFKDGQKKYFNIPPRHSLFANDIINFLTLKKQ